MGLADTTEPIIAHDRRFFQKLSMTGRYLLFRKSDIMIKPAKRWFDMEKGAGYC